MNNIFIETPRLIITHLEEKDFEPLALQQKDPEVMKFWGGARSDEEIAAIFDLLQKHLADFGFSQGPVFLKETGECIGRAGLTYLELDPSQAPEIGYFLLPHYWKRVFATELGHALIQYAFDILGCPKVYASIEPLNIASQRVSQKLGMTFEREGEYERLGKIKVVQYYVKTTKPNKEEKCIV